MSAVAELKFYMKGQKKGGGGLEKNIEQLAEKFKARDNVVAINFDVMQK